MYGHVECNMCHVSFILIVTLCVSGQKRLSVPADHQKETFLRHADKAFVAWRTLPVGDFPRSVKGRLRLPGYSASAFDAVSHYTLNDFPAASDTARGGRNVATGGGGAAIFDYKVSHVVRNAGGEIYFDSPFLVLHVSSVYGSGYRRAAPGASDVRVELKTLRTTSCTQYVRSQMAATCFVHLHDFDTLSSTSSDVIVKVRVEVASPSGGSHKVRSGFSDITLKQRAYRSDASRAYSSAPVQMMEKLGAAGLYFFTPTHPVLRGTIFDLEVRVYTGCDSPDTTRHPDQQGALLPLCPMAGFMFEITIFQGLVFESWTAHASMASLLKYQPSAGLQQNQKGAETSLTLLGTKKASVTSVAQERQLRGRSLVLGTVRFRVQQSVTVSSSESTDLGQLFRIKTDLKGLSSAGTADLVEKNAPATVLSAAGVTNAAAPGRHGTIKVVASANPLRVYTGLGQHVEQEYVNFAPFRSSNSLPYERVSVDVRIVRECVAPKIQPAATCSGEALNAANAGGSTINDVAALPLTCYNLASRSGVADVTTPGANGLGHCILSLQGTETRGGEAVVHANVTTPAGHVLTSEVENGGTAFRIWYPTNLRINTTDSTLSQIHCATKDTTAIRASAKTRFQTSVLSLVADIVLPSGVVSGGVSADSIDGIDITSYVSDFFVQEPARKAAIRFERVLGVSREVRVNPNEFLSGNTMTFSVRCCENSPWSQRAGEGGGGSETRVLTVSRDVVAVSRMDALIFTGVQVHVADAAANGMEFVDHVGDASRAFTLQVRVTRHSFTQEGAMGFLVAYLFFADGTKQGLPPVDSGGSLVTLTRAAPKSLDIGTYHGVYQVRVREQAMNGCNPLVSVTWKGASGLGLDGAHVGSCTAITAEAFANITVPPPSSIETFSLNWRGNVWLVHEADTLALSPMQRDTTADVRLRLRFPDGSVKDFTNDPRTVFELVNNAAAGATTTSSTYPNPLGDLLEWSTEAGKKSIRVRKAHRNATTQLTQSLGLRVSFGTYSSLTQMLPIGIKRMDDLRTSTSNTYQPSFSLVRITPSSVFRTNDPLVTGAGAEHGAQSIAGFPVATEARIEVRVRFPDASTDVVFTDTAFVRYSIDTGSSSSHLLKFCTDSLTNRFCADATQTGSTKDNEGVDITVTLPAILPAGTTGTATLHVDAYKTLHAWIRPWPSCSSSGCGADRHRARIYPIRTASTGTVQNDYSYQRTELFCELSSTKGGLYFKHNYKCDFTRMQVDAPLVLDIQGTRRFITVQDPDPAVTAVQQLGIHVTWPPNNNGQEVVIQSQVHPTSDSCRVSTLAFAGTSPHVTGVL